MFSLTLITPEQSHAHEHAVLTELMQGLGLTVHVRKPLWSAEQYTHYLQAFPEHVLKHLVLHEQHELVETFPVKGIHLKEKDRVHPLSAALTSRLVSTSVHSAEEASALTQSFDYLFFSPVFTSISKEGYGRIHSMEELSFLRAELKKRTTIPVMALGGIHEGNVREVKKSGFDGAALLGAVWQSTDPVQAFEKIRSAIK